MAQEQLIDKTARGDLSAPTEQAGPQRSLLDRSLTEWVRLDWETIAWIGLFIVAVISRFYDLGARAMSHDESLHALYSYYLYNAGNYEHNPMMHGPFLFHANALMYTLFGDNDATARIVPALTGLGVIWMARLFRRYIGRTGALITGLLIVISPSLLFHSRYIRNDIYIALFSMIWIYGAFRYLDTRKLKWVMVMVLGMAFGFIAKENHFMTGAVLGAFFVGLALWEVIGRQLFAVISPLILATGLAYLFHVRDQNTLAIVIVGVAFIIATALTIFFMRGKSWSSYRHSIHLDLAVLMLTLVMPFTAPLGHQIMGWDPLAYTTNTDMFRSVGLVAVVTMLAIIIAYIWYGMRRQDEHRDPFTFGQWSKLMAIFWAIQILFFTTFFTNTRNGLATGIVGSLGYWIKQQEVARGGQPWYYYMMIGGLYEFLPILLTAVGALVALYWFFRAKRWDPVPAGDLPAVIAHEIDADRRARIDGESGGDIDAPAPVALADLLQTNRLYFLALSLWWTLGTWAAYTIAGEKMPWLMTHMALPMCVVGGWYVGRLIWRVDWRTAVRTRAVWLMALTPALILSLALLVANIPVWGREVSALGSVTQWLLALVITAGLLYLGWRGMAAVGWRTGGRLAALGGVALLALLTVRFAYMLAFINYDYATEYLVYAHASPDIKRALNEIDLISERTVGERNIVVAYDDDSSWPLSWYMRQYPNARFYGANPTSDSMSAPVIIVGSANYDKVAPYVARDYVKRTYRQVWWPDQSYFNQTPLSMWRTFTNPDKLKEIFQIVFYRRYPDSDGIDGYRDLTKWPNRHEFEMWVRRDIAADIWDLGVTPTLAGGTSNEALARANEIDVYANVIFNDLYDDLSLNAPRTLDMGVDGSRYIADSGNHRIVVLDPQGALTQTIGSYCNLAEGAASGCVDPDGSGPLELGDGQFFEPWGVAVDQTGTLYVADTWNGRIQTFDSNGEFKGKWGFFNTTNGELGDANALFGPRGIAVDRDGNVLVADTGNKRILHYTPDGQLITQIGGGGVIAGHFEEPTDVAVDPTDGSIFVADAWNRRIQKFAPDLTFVAEWAVPSWESQDRFDKPYLAVDNNGSVYASDPAMFRVFVFNSAGEITASIGNYGTEANHFVRPTGLALDQQTNELLVADADNNRIMQFPPILP